VTYKYRDDATLQNGAATYLFGLSLYLGWSYYYAAQHGVQSS